MTIDALFQIFYCNPVIPLMDNKKLRIMLKHRKSKVSKALRPRDAQPLEKLLELWKRQNECMRINAERLAGSEDYESAAQNSWMSTVFGWCAEDLERSLELYRFETYWKYESQAQPKAKKIRKST